MLRAARGKICSVVLEKGKCRGGVPDTPGAAAHLRAHMECAPTAWRVSTLRANGVCPGMRRADGCRGRRPRRPGGGCSSAGAYRMRPYGVAGERCSPLHGFEDALFRQASTLLYIHIKNTPPGSVGLRAGWLGCLFTSDQTHEAGQAEGERRDIGDCQQGGNQCHKVGNQLGGHLLDGDMADAAADKQDRADRRGDVA